VGNRHSARTVPTGSLAFTLRSPYAFAVDLTTRRARTVLHRVRAVPEGFVTTYGELSPGSPRYAGAVLASSHDPDVPWQRVVRADGSLPKGERQRRLLEQEGVPFAGARVEMRRAYIPARDLVG
jgi:methylated-DNA-protein-cysteine methyltransferase related protein